MKKTTLILGLSLMLFGVFAGSNASAQDTSVTQVTMPSDTLYTEAPVAGSAVMMPSDTLYVEAPATGSVVTAQKPDYGKLLGIKDYDELPDDAILPVTREEAEEVIAAMILAARAPGQDAINRAQVLNDYKIEVLKRRLLEDALRKSYTDEYARRLDRLENFLMLLLANQGLDSGAINNVLAGLGATPQGGSTVVLPGQQGAQAQNLQPGQAGSSALVPGASDGRTPVALAPGAKAASWEHFLSQVFYAFDSSKLDDKAKKVLDDVAGWVKETGMGITLRGWASPEGKMSYNNKLSGRRVNAAADYLKSKGISASLLKVIPSGIDSMKDTKSKYPAGRRVDIRPDYGE